MKTFPKLFHPRNISTILTTSQIYSTLYIFISLSTIIYLHLQRTRRAMSVVGMPVETQDAVFRTVAAVLHLGNITFEDDGNEAAKVSAGDAERSLASAAALLGVEVEGLRRILTTRTRQTPDGESSIKLYFI